jgi:hypothetical protein
MNSSEVGVDRTVESRRMETTAAVIAFLAILLIAFSPWWAGGKVFAPLDITYELYEPFAGGDTDVDVKNHFTTDAVTQYLEYRWVFAESFEADGFVGWDDLVFGGRPLWANTMALPADWASQLHRWFDFWTAWHVGLIVQFAIAGIGMIVFLRSRGMSPQISLVGAVVFAANSGFIFMIYHRWHLASFAWLPWALWAIWRFRDGRRLMWPFVPLFLALALLGGNLQTSAFVLIVLAALAVGLLIDDSEDAKSRGAVLVHFTAWGLLAVALASFWLLPSIGAFLDNLDTGNVRGDPDQWSIGDVIRTVPFLVMQAFPNSLGSPQSIDLARVLGYTMWDAAFFGLAPMVLAVRSLFLRAAPSAAKAMIVAGLLIPLTPLVLPLYLRVQLVFVLGGVWAFCWYWQYGPPASPRALRSLRWIFGGVLALWSLASVVVLAFGERLKPILQEEVLSRINQGEGVFSAYREWLLARADLLVDYVQIWRLRHLLAVAGIGLALWAIGLRSKGDRSRSAVILLVGLLLELGVYTVQWVTVSDLDEYPFPPVGPEVTALVDEVGDGRVYLVQSDGEPVLFQPNMLSAAGVATLQAYDSIVPPNVWQSYDRREEAASLGLAGVTHAVAYADDTPPGVGWEKIREVGQISMWRNTASLPRYLALDSSPNTSDVSGFAESLLAEGESAVVQVVSATANRRLLDVPAGTEWIRVAENWSEGWQYRLRSDGEWTQVTKAPDQSWLIEVDGSQAIELQYARPGRALRALSAATLVGILIALATLYVFDRSNPGDGPMSRSWFRTSSE